MSDKIRINVERDSQGQLRDALERLDEIERATGTQHLVIAAPAPRPARGRRVGGSGT